jgi:hypothetical protein
MSEFEYLAVFMSIIFGISTTHILSGVIRSIYRGQLDQTHFIVVALLAVFVNRPLFTLVWRGTCC